MKIALLSLFFFVQFAQAALPRAAISDITLPVFGVYTSSDPACLTGWVATVPISATPTPFNFAGNPTLGSGPIANPIKCVAFVTQNNLTFSWLSEAAYGASYGSDSNACGRGGTSSGNLICQGSMNATVGQPPQLVEKIKAVGLNVATGCNTTAALDQVIIFYLSTYSACYGNTVLDADISGCLGNSGFSANNTFNMPTSEGDKSNGMKLVTPGAGARYKMVVDPDRIVGNNNGACRLTSAPKFSFAVK